VKTSRPGRAQNDSSKDSMSPGASAVLEPRTPASARPSVSHPPPELEDDDYIPSDPLAFLKKFGDAPAWVLSLGLHVLVLLILSSFVYDTTRDLPSILTTTMEDVESNPDFDAVVVDQVGTNGETSLALTAADMATNRAESPQEQVLQQLEQEIRPVNIPLTDEIVSLPESDLVSTHNSRGPAVTENTGGTEGALDRLTFEIASSLKERKTLVVWLFDASLSMKQRRDEIADRFENVYRQLDALDVGADKALKTAVAAFGETTTLLTPNEPIDDIRTITQAVRNIPNDVSGVENVFTAVRMVTNKWKSYRAQSRRNMLLIIVTDERGDDYAQLEEVINLVRSNGIRVYVVGNAAPFGREKGFLSTTYSYSDGGRMVEVTEDLPADQGPETVAPEYVRLAFWGSNGGDLERMSATFGPYALTRLCAETGGQYLISHDDDRAHKFPLDVMRNYLPDYRPIREYEAELRKNKAKAALVACARQTFIENIPVPQLQFQATNDTVLRQQATEAQKPAAVLEARLAEMMTILSEGEKDREKLTDPRWQASYDLAMGRVLAMRARLYGYNMVLAEMKASPKTFEKPGSNTWRLVPSPEITSGPSIKKLAQKATEYLKRVVDKHPDTPWGLLAERELSQPMGWEWKESTVDYARLGIDENGKKRILLADEEEKQKKEQEKRKQMQKQRPKL